MSRLISASIYAMQVAVQMITAALSVSLLVGCGIRSNNRDGVAVASPVATAATPSDPLTPYPGNPMLRNGPESYDYGKTGPRVVLKEGPTTYKLWYEAVAAGGLTGVAYAISTDGLSWIKQGVVLSPDQTSWEKMEVSPNSVLYEGGVYKLWYHGGGYFLPGDGTRYGSAEVGYATSPDGVNWTRYPGNPVLSLGPVGSFDDHQVAEPRVFNLADGYRMYFTGETRDSSNTQYLALGIATSRDGINWTKYSGNPVIPTGIWDGWGGAFFFEEGVWRLWHATPPNDSGLSYKSSGDGISWTEGPNNPVLTPSPDPTSPLSFVGDSISGYRDDSTYRLMFTGFSSNLFGSLGRFEGICLAYIDVGPSETSDAGVPHGSSH